jgi:2-oxoglutarate dehydrogenase E2 component (dihydrolipoamide succinyltransferase)
MCQQRLLPRPSPTVEAARGGVVVASTRRLLLSCVGAVAVLLAEIQGTDIVYKDYVDISCAVSSPSGLVTPVLRACRPPPSPPFPGCGGACLCRATDARGCVVIVSHRVSRDGRVSGCACCSSAGNCEKMTFADAEGSLQGLAMKARDGKLTVEDMTGGNFTISNGGIFGSLFGTPIINPPQSAVLGMHAIKPRAVVVDGQVVSRPMMYIALTYDHRIVDGREGVGFLKHIKECVEDPHRLLLGI